MDVFEEENVQNNDATYSTFIRAAYDPNIKTAIPNGYREQHYIDLNQDRIEYIVEFQNTGNYPAQNIVIVDSLSSLFDHSSIEILGTSHYMEIAYYDSELKFIFPNILLVDSTTNEPESHGFVHYSIALQPDLPAYTEIQNKALIYFDFNEAIVTNTTLNTLYDCESFSPEFQLESVIDCPISEISAAFNSDFIDSNEWWIDNTLHTNGINFNAEVTSGLHGIQHIISNELCGQKTHAIEIDINSSIPLDLSSINGTIFANSTLNAIIYYWYVDGELITTTDVGMLSTTVSGSYAVTAIDPDGCLASSHDFEYIYTSLGEIGKSNLSIYPNPTTGIINLNIPASLTNTILHIIDPTGATVKTVSCTGREVVIDCSDLSDGVYILRVENQETHGESRFVLFH